MGEMTEGRKRFIHQAYNDEGAHGTYCPCKRCEEIYGPLPQWIHDIGKLEKWY